MMSTNKEEDYTARLIAQLTQFLDAEKTKDALALATDTESAAILKECSWEVIPVITSYLTLHNSTYKSELFKCCEVLLDVIADMCYPDETLLEFLEQAECPDNDTKFCALLKPLGKSLKKVTNKVRSVEWCVGTIKSHVDQLPMPENQKVEGEEAILLDADPAVFRIIGVYRAILSFLSPLVYEAAIFKEVTVDHGEVLQATLVSLLGKPFCCLELKDSTSLGRPIAEKMITYTSYLTGDLLRFFKFVDQRSTKRSGFGNSQTKGQPDLFSSEDSVSSLAYGNFYFLILGTQLASAKIPCVYHPHYVLHCCLYLSSCFLQEAEYLLISKGLFLAEAALARVDKLSVNAEALELNVHANFFKDLIQVIIHCDSSNERTLALRVFTEYIARFTMRARYLVLLHLYDICNHSGLLSFLTTIFKDSIINCLEVSPCDPNFTGKKMHILLKKACRLPHGKATDLVEIADEMISSLNLVRFLAIRDRSNVTGIWDCIGTLQRDFLEPLREGLEISRAHYKVKIKDLERQEKVGRCKGKKCRKQRANDSLDDEVVINVGGEKLPVMPVREKVKFCCQALIAFDVMESILMRVNECIADNRTV